MARTTRVVHTCDLHGDETEASTSVLLTSGKKRIELDVCQAHLDQLLEAGRKPTSTGGPPSKGWGGGTRRAATRRTGKARQTGPSTADVRAWAIERGHSVSSRGRVPGEVVAAYSEAHGQDVGSAS
jgi:hypothetical protein